MHTVNLFQMLLLLIANSVYIRKTVTVYKAYNMHVPHTLCNEQQLYMYLFSNIMFLYQVLDLYLCYVIVVRHFSSGFCGYRTA